jgi:hypothetical protein
VTGGQWFGQQDPPLLRRDALALQERRAYAVNKCPAPEHGRPA